MSAKHTPGPWHVVGNGVREIATARNIADVRRAYGDGASEERDANAELIAASPDHALLLAAFARGVVRWEPFNLNARYPEANVGRGEVCIDGMRHSTGLDDFGCPRLTDGIRAALRKAGRL